MPKTSKANKPRAGSKRRQRKSPRNPAAQNSNNQVGFLQPKRYSSTNPVAGGRTNMHTTVCSIIDPFCIHARGAQYPDGVGGPTIPMQLRGITSIAADGTTGTGAVVFVPNPVYPKLDALSHVATLWTWNSTSGTSPIANSFFTSNANEARIVSWGLVIRSQMTASTAKGSIIVQTLTQPPYSGTYTSGAINTPYAQVHALSAGTQISWVSQPLGPDARAFKPLSAYTNSLSNVDWTGLQIEVVNGDITSNIVYLSVEVIFNIEFNLLANNGLNQVVKPPPKPNDLAVRAAEAAQSSIAPFIEGGVTAATNYLGRIAMGAVSSLLPPPFRMIAGGMRAMEVD